MAETHRQPRRATIIYNPRAGSATGGEALIQLATETLSQHRILASAVATQAPGDAARLAREAMAQGCELIIVRGGDGTLNEALQGIVGSDVHLALWPAGTANVLASVLGVPRDLDSVIKIIVGDKAQRISIGRAGSRYFFLMAGIGLDASIVRGINPVIKRHGGILAFWVSGLKHLLERNLPAFTLELDGRQFTGTFAAIANAPLYGGGVIMAPDARLDDEFFRVCLFQPRHGIGYLPYLPFAFSGRHLKMRGVVYLKAQHARATADCEVQVQVDGELAGTLPMSFELIPAAVSVLVP